MKRSRRSGVVKSKNKNNNLYFSKKVSRYISSYWNNSLKTLCGSIEKSRIINKTTFKMMESIYNVPENKRISIVSPSSSDVYIFHVDELNAYFNECEKKQSLLYNPHDKKHIFSKECRRAVEKMSNIVSYI